VCGDCGLSPRRLSPFTPTAKRSENNAAAELQNTEPHSMTARGEATRLWLRIVTAALAS